MSDLRPQIEVVTDLDEGWPEIVPLLHALHLHHEPLVGARLLPDWDERQREHLRSLLEGGDERILLARVAGRAVGFANGSVRRDPGVMRELLGAINNVYVVPELRGAGIARLLVSALERWFRERGASEVQLSVVAANAPAVEVWRGMGFETLSYRMRKPLD